MVGVPALRTDQEVVVLGLDDLPAKNFELETEVAAVALGNRVLA
jgi:hypothetical protein